MRLRLFAAADPRRAVFLIHTFPLSFSTMSQKTPIHIQAPSLREWVLAEQPQSTTNETQSSSPSPPIPKTFKVVDVRDDDYIGGHIPGSLNVPSRQLSTPRIDSLVDELKDNEAVIFTCALSQQRGPNVFSSHDLLTLGCTEILDSTEV